MTQRRALVIIVVTYVVLAVVYSFVTPIFEAPDEVWHYAVVREIALNRQLPVSIADPAEPWAQEGLQSPLYYLLSAPLIAWMPGGMLRREPPRNPFARIGVPEFGSTDNNNVFLHTTDPTSPFDNAALAVHLLRLFSVVIGATTVIFTYLLAAEIFSDPIIALLAAVFVAFLPQFLFISGAISNDSLATATAVASLWFLARLHRTGFTMRRAIVLGVFVGAALLSKDSTEKTKISPQRREERQVFFLFSLFFFAPFASSRFNSTFFQGSHPKSIHSCSFPSSCSRCSNCIIVIGAPAFVLRYSL